MPDSSFLEGRGELYLRRGRGGGGLGGRFGVTLKVATVQSLCNGHTNGTYRFVYYSEVSLPQGLHIYKLLALGTTESSISQMTLKDHGHNVRVPIVTPYTYNQS